MELPPGSEMEDTPLPSRYDSKDTLLKKYDIPISYLDFAFVEKCTDGKLLERILQILQSGEEGYYPQLTDATAERLRLIKPHSRYIRAVTQVVDRNSLDSQTRTEMEHEMLTFVQNVSQHDTELEKFKKTGCIDIPEIRKTVNTDTTQPDKEKQVNRIKATDYASWDKYDPDTEILKMDLETENLRKKQAEIQKRPKAKPRKEVKFENVYTETEAVLQSSQERLKGNEYYKSRDYKEAIACYTTSISMNPTIEGYNNRAQAHIMMKNFQQAMTDSQAALKFDPQNIKANMRLAQSFNELHFYHDAIKHLELIIYLDPNNTSAQNLLNTVKSKLARQMQASGDSAWPKEGKTRMKITEISSTSTMHNNSPSQRNKNRRKSILKKSSASSSSATSQVIVPIPGPSHMQEPYYVVMEDKDPEMIKRAQYMLYNKPQVMFVCHPPDSEDEDYLDQTADYYVSDDQSNTRSTTTLKDINQKIESFARDKEQKNSSEYLRNLNENGYSLYSNSVKENNQNKLNIRLPNIDLRKESSVEITEITNDDDSNHCSSFSNCSSTENVKTEEKTKPTEKISHEEEAKAILNIILNNTGNNTNNFDANNNDNDRNQSGADGSNNTLKGGSGEPHSEVNGNAVPEQVDDIETPFSFLRAWTAVQRDDTYTQHANVLRSVTANRFIEVVGYKLDGTMLADILRTLYLHFTVPHEVERMRDFLTNMAALPRFNVVSLFLAEADRAKARILFQFLEQHGLPLSDAIKHSYL